MSLHVPIQTECKLPSKVDKYHRVDIRIMLQTNTLDRQIQFVVWCLERTVDMMGPEVENLCLVSQLHTTPVFVLRLTISINALAAH